MNILALHYLNQYITGSYQFNEATAPEWWSTPLLHKLPTLQNSALLNTGLLTHVLLNSNLLACCVKVWQGSEKTNDSMIYTSPKLVWLNTIKNHHNHIHSGPVASYVQKGLQENNTTQCNIYVFEHTGSAPTNTNSKPTIWQAFMNKCP
jgi:hypothetical protein